MKINDELDLCEFKDGRWYLRSARKDNRNPSLRSPARKAFYRRFRAVASQHVTGFTMYKGVRMPTHSVVIAEGMKGTIDAPHVDYRVLRRQRLWDLLERSGSVLVQAWDRIVAVVQTS